MYAAKSGKYCRYNSYAGGCKKRNCPFKHINVCASKFVKESEIGDKFVLKSVSRFSLKRKIYEGKEDVSVSINHKYTTNAKNNPEKKMKVEEVSISTTESDITEKKSEFPKKAAQEKEEKKEKFSSRTNVKSFTFKFEFEEELDYEP